MALTTRELEGKLQSLIVDVYSRPPYSKNSAFKNYQEQLEKVRDGFNAIYTTSPDVSKYLHQGNSNLIVVADKTKLQNICKSATECLRLSQSLYPNESDFLLFLSLVKDQSYVAYNALVITKTTPSVSSEEKTAVLEALNQRFSECIIDIDIQQEIMGDKFEEIIKKTNEAKESLQETKTTANNMIPNMLAVLGIFVGVIVAVVACYLSVILTEHREMPGNWIYSRPLDFMRILLLGHIILSTVFLLMYLVAKLTSKTISNECRYREPQDDDDGKGDTTSSRCRTCKKCCRAPVRFVRRYPYIFSINLVFFVGYVVLAIWQAINIYYREPFDDAMKKLGLRQFVFVLVGIVVAIVLVCLVTYCIRKLIKWIRNKKAA